MNIKEVAQKYDLTADTLRYYEKVGLIPKVNRNEVGYRDFTEEDINWVEFAKCMRNAGMSVEALSKYVALFQKGDSTIAERKQILLDQQAIMAEKLSDLQATYKRLTKKVDNYDSHIAKFEEEKLENKEHV
ncbi:MerR family transcriptional regulator [Companilactobacillus baiquanensis]|uniref:MerR family transcriptional regulator n=1 Tax=Companilactobacillus baiquanensis TaxID=2486005 RepID=A0ABW1UXH7_9LACO|nr:MerR family transcriptional regulator [Companilactobacillus baiquanensis]